MGGKMIRFLFVALLASLLAACSSGSGGAPARTSGGSAFVTHYGQDAAIIAGHIPGCTGVRAEQTVPPKATSGATCRLFGHTVEVLGWGSSAAEPHQISHLSGSRIVGLTFARGRGWTASVGDVATPDAQRAVAQRAASALGGTLVSASSG